jgi:hypothetical protein
MHDDKMRAQSRASLWSQAAYWEHSGHNPETRQEFLSATKFEGWADTVLAGRATA